MLRFLFAEPELEELTFSGAPVMIPDRVDHIDQDLTVGTKMLAFFFQGIGAGGQYGFRTEIVMDDEVYFESGELAS